MKTFLPPKVNPLGHAKHGVVVKLERDDAVWENPLIAPGALALFNGFATESELTISANQSISNSGVKKILIALVSVCLLVAGFSYAQGNVWVLFFVILDLAIVCAAVLALAGARTASDSLFVDDCAGLLLVRSTNKRTTSQQTFNISWVRLQVEGPLEARRIYLTASGRSVEIGSFLNHEQRVSLLDQLKSFLELAKARVLN